MTDFSPQLLLVLKQNHIQNTFYILLQLHYTSNIYVYLGVDTTIITQVYQKHFTNHTSHLK